ncbi:MAG: hypothetical protein HGGPFJEG_01872 [Ignavibacteria bacterium]|nr:hypothetical protein [Ignavibacteria bacterium]
MKNNRKFAESEAEKTIELFLNQKEDEIQADPYFTSRILSIVKENEEMLFMEKFRLNYIIPITLFIIFLFNIFTFFYETKTDSANLTGREEIRQSILNEYSLTDY